MSKRPAVLYISHGGGPLPLLGDAGHREMTGLLRELASFIRKPSSILVISAHWEEAEASVTCKENPELLYDYYGFPEESYEVKYPAPPDRMLSEKVFEALSRGGIHAKMDSKRDFDHGLFVPLKIMYPDADIPCVQLSLIKGLDAGKHIELGRALSGLEHEGLLILGSGFSFHNMREFFTAPGEDSVRKNEEFERWLIETCNMRGDKMQERLIEWEKAPSARFCHPREEHLLPLHVCSGAANRACDEFYRLSIINKRASFYLWQ